jgi:hypothetical protein
MRDPRARSAHAGGSGALDGVGAGGPPGRREGGERRRGRRPGGDGRGAALGAPSRPRPDPRPGGAGRDPRPRGPDRSHPAPPGRGRSVGGAARGGPALCQGLLQVGYEAAPRQVAADKAPPGPRTYGGAADHGAGAQRRSAAPPTPLPTGNRLLRKGQLLDRPLAKVRSSAPQDGTRAPPFGVAPGTSEDDDDRETAVRDRGQRHLAHPHRTLHSREDAVWPTPPGLAGALAAPHGGYGPGVRGRRVSGVPPRGAATEKRRRYADRVAW